MSYTEPETIKTARQPHFCSWCAEQIKVGEAYTRYRWFAHGEASTVKLHPECYAAMLEVTSEEGGEIEWCPGDYERPEPKNAVRDELIPMGAASTAHERECSSCGAEPGQMCSSEDPKTPGLGVEHAILIHRCREE